MGLFNSPTLNTLIIMNKLQALSGKYSCLTKKTPFGVFGASVTQQKAFYLVSASTSFSA